MIRSALLAALLLLSPLAAAEDPPPAPIATGALAPVLGSLTEDALFQEAVVGMQVVNVRTGEEVFNWQGDRGMVPASVMKMLTTATALRNLGPSWQFSTDILISGDLQPDGVLKGNVYVKGYGDPTLVVEKLWRMVADLQVAGVSVVEGDILFDNSYFDDSPLIPGWEKDADVASGPAYFAPLSALSVNYNTACIIVAPGGEVGQPARVQLDSPVPVITLVNETVTGRKGSRRWLRIDREVDETGDLVTFTLKGNIPVDAEVDRSYRAVGNPLPHFIGVFEGVAKERGLKVKGKLKEGVTPADARRVVHAESVPLASILADMNKHSSNFIAEQLTRVMSAEKLGAPGSTEKGMRLVHDYLTGIGLDDATFTLVNGSGLARGTSLPPSAITAVLLDMVNDRKLGPEFLASLAIGGVDGTLWARFREEDEVGRIRGKTGSLNGVYCLAGLVDAGDGDLYAFAFLVNDLKTSSWPVRRLQEAFADTMVSLGAQGEDASKQTLGTR